MKKPDVRAAIVAGIAHCYGTPEHEIIDTTTLGPRYDDVLTFAVMQTRTALAAEHAAATTVGEVVLHFRRAWGDDV